MPFATFIKTPLTDLTGTLCTHQYYGKCANLEMKTINCFEAYGMDRAAVLCKDIIEDFKECTTSFKTRARILEMRHERFRQIRNNERPKEEHFAPSPRLDSYQ